MSVQKAKDFLVKIATDEAAATKARAAHESALLVVAKELGYSFDATDLRDAMADIEDLDELSPEALEGVSGGLHPRLPTTSPTLGPNLRPLVEGLFGLPTSRRRSLLDT
jgi:predicted ribosomally synthesized peptide with nif11-like leader